MLMNSIALVKASLQNRKGVTAAEYAVLAAGIVLAVGAAAAALGSALSTKFGAIFT